MRLPLSLLISTMCLQIAYLFTSCSRTSHNSGGLDLLSWPALYLEFLQWMRKFWISEEKARQKYFLKYLHQSNKHVFRIICDLLLRYPLRLHCTYHHSVTFMGIFPCSFSDCMDFPLPRLCTLFQPITFVLVIPDKPPRIMYTCTHLKSINQAKPFSSFKIIQMHNQSLLQGLG